MIRWIFFDLDGVLLDARSWHFEAFQAALHEQGIELDHHTHMRLYDGLPTKRKLALLAERLELAPATIAAVRERKQEITRRFLAERIVRSEALVALLTKLRSQGLRLALCSNAIKETVETCLARLEVGAFFEVVLSSDDVADPKPAPEMYELALRRAGAAAHEVLIIEDSPHGVAAAQATACHLLVVRDAQDLSWEKLSALLGSAGGR